MPCRSKSEICLKDENNQCVEPFQVDPSLDLTVVGGPYNSAVDCQNNESAVATCPDGSCPPGTEFRLADNQGQPGGDPPLCYYCAGLPTPVCCDPSTEDGVTVGNTPGVIDVYLDILQDNYEEGGYCIWLGSSVQFIACGCGVSRESLSDYYGDSLESVFPLEDYIPPFDPAPCQTAPGTIRHVLLDSIPCEDLGLG